MGPTSHITVPGFEPSLHFWSNFLLMNTLGDCKGRLKYLSDTTHRGDLVGVWGCLLGHRPPLAVVGFWEMRHGQKVSLSLLLYILNKLKKLYWYEEYHRNTFLIKHPSHLKVNES